MLESYVAGRWFAATDDGAPRRRRGDRRDRRPGQQHRARRRRRCSTTPARVGGPALRELTFHQRAGAAQAARPAPDGATRTSSTRCRTAPAPPTATSPSTSTAASARCSSYASKASRELPDDTVYLDGAVEPLGRGGTFVGQHVCTPLRGRRGADQRLQLPGVGASLEKLAPAFLAGVPTRRQAGEPDRVPHRGAWSGGSSSPACCPRARCSCSPAAPADLLDHLTGQDLVVFTGSAATAREAAQPPGRGAPTRCGSTPRPTRSTARSSARTPTPGHPGVRPVRQAARHRDDRQGGPEVHRDPPRAGAPRARRRRRRGHPRAAGEGRRSATPATDGVTMGALASLDQREEVRRARQGAARRRRDRVRRPGRLRGGRRRPRPRRVPAADAAALRRPRTAPSRTTSRRSARSARCCRTTATAEHAVELAARGQGSLVGSVVTARRGRSPARSCWASRRGTAGSWCSTATTPRSPPATARRCRCWCTADRAAPAAARSSAASAACCTTCSAPPSRPSPDVLDRGHRPVGDRRRRARRRRAPVPQVAGRAADRRHGRSPGRAR